jgi:hypothetical protein
MPDSTESGGVQPTSFALDSLRVAAPDNSDPEAGKRAPRTAAPTVPFLRTGAHPRASGFCRACGKPLFP